MQREARSAGAAARAQWKARAVLRPVLEAVPDVQRAAAEVPSRVQAQPLEPLRAAVAEVVPSARLQAEAGPSVPRQVAVGVARPWVQPVVAAAVRPSEVPEAEEEPPAAGQAAAEVRRVEVRAVGAEQPSAAPEAAQEQPLAARVVLLSAVPSVRSDRPARARLARRRMTTASRREPALAQTERLRLQSSSAG